MPTFSDELLKSILAKPARYGLEVGDDFARLLAQSTRELSDFEHLLRQPWRHGTSFESVQTGREIVFATRAERLAELGTRLERLQVLARGLAEFARLSFPGFVASAIGLRLVELLGDLWTYTHPEPLDPDEYNRGLCGAGLEPCAGIWRTADADGVFDLLDAYAREVEREFDLMGGHTVPGVVRAFWIDVQADYIAAATSLTENLRNTFAASKFGAGHGKKIRYGVHPRGAHRK